MGKALGAIIGIAAIFLAGPLVTAVTGLTAASGLSFMIARAVVSMGIQALGSSLLGKSRDSSGGTSVRDSGILANEASGIAPIPIVYGRRKVGTRRVYLNVSDNNQKLHMVMAVAEGQIGRIRKVYFNDTLVVDFTIAGAVRTGDVAGGEVISGTDNVIVAEKYRNYLRMQYRLGTDTQTAYGYLTDKFPEEWPATSKCSGVANVYFELTFNRDVYQAVPTITLEIDGLKIKKVDDLSGSRYAVAYRSSTDGELTYTEPAAPYNDSYGANPADVVYDYLTNTRYGKGIETTNINLASFQATKEYTSNTVQVTFGEELDTFTRNFINGHCEPDDTIYANIKRILSSFGGYLIFSNGQYYLKCDKEETVEDVNDLFQITEDNVIGQIDLQLGSKQNRFNRIKFTYYDRDAGYNPSIRYYYDQSYFERDNEQVLEHEIEMAMVTDQRDAMTQSAIFLNKSRYQNALTVTCSWSAFSVEVGDLVAVTLPNFGWTQKAFRVMGSNISPDGTVQLTMMEYVADTYQVTTLTELIYDGEIVLPDFTLVAAPSGWTSGYPQTRVEAASDGSKQVFIDAQWSASPDATVTEYEVKVEGSSGTTYIQYARTANTSISFGPLPNGTYDVSVRSINAYGNRSGYLN